MLDTLPLASGDIAKSIAPASADTSAPATVPPHAPALVLDAEGCVMEITDAARTLLRFEGAARMPDYFFSLVHGNNLYQTMRDVADMVCYGKARATWMLRMRTGQRAYQWVHATVINRLQRDEGTIVVWLRPA